MTMNRQASVEAEWLQSSEMIRTIFDVSVFKNERPEVPRMVMALPIFVGAVKVMEHDLAPSLFQQYPTGHERYFNTAVDHFFSHG
jgi:hypothetical protein